MSDKKTSAKVFLILNSDGTRVIMSADAQTGFTIVQPSDARMVDRTITGLDIVDSYEEAFDFILGRRDVKNKVLTKTGTGVG